MAVARDDTGINEINFSGVTTVTLSTLTVGAGANRYLVAAINGGGTSGMGITWNGVAMTQVASSPVVGADSDDQYLFGLTNPANGNLSLVATWVGATSGNLAAIEFSGVDQTTPVVNADTITDATVEASSSHAVTSGASDATLGVGCAEHAFTVSSVNQTQFYLDNVSSRPSAGNYALGGASNTHTITYSASNGQASMFIHIRAAAAAGGSTWPGYYSSSRGGWT